MNSCHKILSLLTFIFTVQTATSKASELAEVKPIKQAEYRLEKLYQKKIKLQKLEKETKSLIKEGFPPKRAMEVGIQQYIARIFEEKIKFNLFPIGEILLKIGGSCEKEFYKTDEGVIDDIFTTADIDWQKKGDAPIVYNETHYVKDSDNIIPLDIRTLKDRYSYTYPYLDLWTGYLKSEILRPSGKIITNLSPSLLGTVSQLQTALNSRLEEARIGHTLTLLKSDGTLTLFNVTREY